MLKQLNGLVGLLVEALKAGDFAAGERAQASLLDWCDSNLVPHALAEEGLLYEGPRALPEGKLLVEGMLAENCLLLPLIAELSGLSLAEAAEGLHELTGEAALRRGHGHDAGHH